MVLTMGGGGYDRIMKRKDEIMKNFKFLLVALIGFCGFLGSAYAEAYSQDFQKLTTDGIVRLNAIKDPIIVEFTDWGMSLEDAALQEVLGNIDLGDSRYWSWDCSSSTECVVSIYESKVVDGNYLSEVIESHQVKLEYMIEKSDSIATKVENVMKQIKTVQFYDEEQTNNYVLEDLNLINYYLTQDLNKVSYVSNIMNFIPDIISLIQNQPITISLVAGMGGSGDDTEYIGISGLAGGTAIVYYNGVAYGYIDHTGANIYNIIYIPENTENTKEAYVEAIKARLNNSSIEVTCAGVIPENSETVYVSLDGIDLSKTDGNYYKLKINGQVYPFVVMKKAELNVPKYEQVEETTGVRISTTDLSIPFDTVITVEEVKENTEAYSKIVEVLKVSNFKAFDISLYSETLGTNITKLENGLFQVTIPIGKEYVGKNMAAYYINADNTIEEHDIIMDVEGNATFETDHFSTYIITEKLPSVAEPIPDTYDGIMNYVFMGILALVTLGSATTYLNKKSLR